MQSLGTEPQDTFTEAESVRAEATRRLVLPRVFRRPVRALNRLDWKLPRFTGIKGLAALFLVTAATGMAIGGHSMTVASAVTAFVGFGIENVKISGQSETSEVDVLAALDIGTYPSLLTLELDSAKARIEALPWVKHASLKKLFPDALEIEIAERDPYALWQHDGVVSLIDDAGRVITEDVGERYASMPRVVGPGAATMAVAYNDLIAKFPTIAAHARAGVYVSGRRWTIVLDNGMQLMLPPDNPEAALATIASMQADHAVFSREIAAIDLRRPGQLVVRLTEEGALARKAALQERAKVAQRGRTNT